jgi:hypothetical protein
MTIPAKTVQIILLSLFQFFEKFKQSGTIFKNIHQKINQHVN